MNIPRLPMNVYTWAILTVLDLAETPFLEATYFPTGVTRMGMLSEREIRSYADNYLRSRGVFGIFSDDDQFTDAGSFIWDHSFSKALVNLAEHECLEIEGESAQGSRIGEIISVTQLGRALVSDYDLHIDIANLHVYLFERCQSEKGHESNLVDPISCPRALKPAQIPNALTGNI